MFGCGLCGRLAPRPKVNPLSHWTYFCSGFATWKHPPQKLVVTLDLGQIFGHLMLLGLNDLPSVTAECSILVATIFILSVGEQTSRCLICFWLVSNGFWPKTLPFSQSPSVDNEWLLLVTLKNTNKGKKHDLHSYL